jgi:predicted permease
MSIFRAAKAGLRALVQRREVDQETDDELSHFLELTIQENLRAGMEPLAAERAARIHVGGVAARETVRASGWEAHVDAALHDVRHAARGLRLNKGFTAIAVLTLMLGVGATTSIFSVVNAVMLRPLPYRDASRVALIWTDDTRRGLHREGTAYRTVEDWRAENRTFEDVAYYSTQRIAPMSNDPLAGRGRSRSALVSSNLFAVLGVVPAEGRLITSADEKERASVAVISYAFWQRWFGGAKDVVGRAITVEDPSRGGRGELTVIGIMPAGFYFPDALTEMWVPATTYWRFERESTERFPSWARRWTAVGRLRDGVTIENAQTDMTRVGRRLTDLFPGPPPDFPGFTTTVLPVLDFIAGRNLQSTLWMLLGAVFLVLLVACVNVANLTLARGAARGQEFAVRSALGAGRFRLARQLITESLLLALLGGGAGVAFAAGSTRVLSAAAVVFVPRIGEMSMDGNVLAFALVVSVAAGLVFGVAPALRVSHTQPNAALKATGQATSRLPRAGMSFLIMGQCALAIILLTGAGLLLRSLERLQSVDPGFDPRQVMTMRIEFPSEPPPTAEERRQTSVVAPSRAAAREAAMADLLSRLDALPGVEAVGFSDDLFLGGQGNESITIPGRASFDAASGELSEGAATPGFFSTLHVPLMRGRYLTRDDAFRKIRALWSPIQTDLDLAEKERRAFPEPVVVNEAFVRRFFPSEDPIGKRFCTDPANKTYWYEIVGVVGDMHRQGLERPAIPEYFGPYFPSPNGRADLLVRTAGDPLDLTATARQEVLRAFPNAGIATVSTADAQLGGFSALRRLQTFLLAGFALVALLLAGIGIFGLAHYRVAERTGEIGVRVALGATPGHVMGLILSDGLWSPGIGVAIGLVSSAVLSRSLSSLVFGVGLHDPVTFALVGVVLLLVALSACVCAGRGALRVEPTHALRRE